MLSANHCLAPTIYLEDWELLSGGLIDVDVRNDIAKELSKKRNRAEEEEANEMPETPARANEQGATAKSSTA